MVASNQLIPAVRSSFVLVAVGIMCGLLTACGEGPTAPVVSETSPVASASEGSSPGATDAGHDAFCLLAAPLRVAVEREFIGSDEHVQQFRDVAEVAPQDLVELISTLGDHYERNVSPAAPESQNFDNFPPHIQQSALDLDHRIQELCGP